MKKFVNVLKQLGKMVCYVGLLFGMQLIIDFTITFVYTFVEAFKAGMRGETVTEELSRKLSEEAVEFMLSCQSWVIIGAAVLTLLILWAFFAIRKKKVLTEVRFLPIPVSTVAPAILLGIGGWLIVEFGMRVLPIPDALMESYGEQAVVLVNDSILLMILANVLAAPIVEEIILRGLVLSRLRRAMPAWVALLISSIVFGLMHGHPLWIAYASLLGLLFGATAVITGSVRASIVVHMTLNLFGTIISGLLTAEVPFAGEILAVVAGAVIVVLGFGLLKRIMGKKEKSLTKAS